MANAWTEFVKKWASDNKMSYGCALSDQKMKEAYQKNKSQGSKITVKRIPKPKDKSEEPIVIPPENVTKVKSEGFNKTIKRMFK
jgi:hypothetical protein